MPDRPDEQGNEGDEEQERPFAREPAARCFTGAVRDDDDTVATEAQSVVLAGFDPDGRATVERGLHSDDPMVRARALGAAARLGRRTVAQRVAGLVDDSPLVRRRACQLEARGPRPSTRVTEALVARLADADGSSSWRPRTRSARFAP